MAPRLSIADLMGLVVFAAINFAVVKGAPWLVPDLAFAYFLIANCLATIGVYYRPGRLRASCAGFALFGWAYVMLGIMPLFAPDPASTRWNRPPYLGPDFILLLHLAFGFVGATLCAVLARRFAPRKSPAPLANSEGAAPPAAVG